MTVGEMIRDLSRYDFDEEVLLNVNRNEFANSRTPRRIERIHVARWIDRDPTAVHLRGDWHECDSEDRDYAEYEYATIINITV